MGNSLSAFRDALWEPRPVSSQREKPTFTNGRLPQPQSVRERKVNINVVDPASNIYNHRFDCSIICALSNTVKETCKKKRTGDVPFELRDDPNLFANYARWVHERDLPIPKVGYGEKVDTVRFYLDLHQLGVHMEDSRLVSRCREEFIELFRQRLLDLYNPSIEDHIKDNHDTLRSLFLDFFVVEFGNPNLADKNLPDLPLDFLGDMINATNDWNYKALAMQRLQNSCRSFHHHDRLFLKHECRAARRPRPESW